MNSETAMKIFDLFKTNKTLINIELNGKNIKFQIIFLTIFFNKIKKMASTKNVFIYSQNH